MLPIVPSIPAWAWKWGAVALAVGALSTSCYVAGRKAVRGEMDALRRSYEVAAAQAAGREAERVRTWQQALTVAGAKYNERAQMADRSFDANLDSLRRAYNSSSARLRPPAPAAQGCAEPSGPTAAELLRAGEALAGIIRDADRDRAALISCVASYPR